MLNRIKQPAKILYLGGLIKTILELVGIDLSRFKPHSMRPESPSAAAVAKVPVDTILRTDGWSGLRTFEKYYRKPIQQHGELAKVLLDNTQPV